MMEAGPELDLLVEQVIFSKPKHYYDCPHFDKKTGRLLSFCSCPDLPRRSKDIAAAWEVHKLACSWLFSKRRLYFKALQKAVSKRVSNLEKGRSEVQTHEDDRIAWPDVLIFLKPVDICNAALEVVNAS